jgi:hypothetical protein
MSTLKAELSCMSHVSCPRPPQTFRNGLSELKIYSNSPVTVSIFNVKNLLPGPQRQGRDGREGEEGKEGKRRERNGTKRRRPQF